MYCISNYYELLASVAYFFSVAKDLITFWMRREVQSTLELWKVAYIVKLLLQYYCYYFRPYPGRFAPKTFRRLDVFALCLDVSVSPTENCGQWRRRTDGRRRCPQFLVGETSVIRLFNRPTFPALLQFRPDPQSKSKANLEIVETAQTGFQRFYALHVAHNNNCNQHWSTGLYTCRHIISICKRKTLDVEDLRKKNSALLNCDRI